MTGDRAPRSGYMLCCKMDNPPSGSRKLRYCKRRHARWVRRFWNRQWQSQNQTCE